MDSKTIYKRFIDAQGEFPPVIKNKKGGQGHYATLDQCLDTIMPVLNRHGLAFTQKTRYVEGGVCVESFVWDETGASISSGEFFISLAGIQQKGAQAFGSGLTYARRYSLLTFMGLAPEDDDGRKASVVPEQTAAAPALPIEIEAKVFEIAETGYQNLIQFCAKQTEDIKKVLRSKAYWPELQQIARKADAEKSDG